MRETRQIPLNKKAFECIDGRCWLFELAIEQAGLSVQYFRKEKSQKNPKLEFINHPKDKRFTLLAFDTMSEGHQAKIRARWNDPYEYVAKEPIRQLLILDEKAEQFYRDHRYDGDKFLLEEYVMKYTVAASWLQVLAQLNDDKKYIKKELKLPLDKFWICVCEIIKTDNIDLPSSYGRLIQKIKDFKENGFPSLIDWRFGNKLAAKVGKTESGFDPGLYEKQVAFIRRGSSMHQNFDAEQITVAVNQVFKAKGWPELSSSTVYNIIQKNKPLTISGSRGKREYGNTIAMQHLRKRPDYPLYYLTLDGWTVELLYRDGNDYNNRLVMVVVLDPFNNYPLGYAIGDRENTDLIMQANRNAAIHITELFGSQYQPRQLQSDNYGIKTLTPFYSAMAKLHTPAAVGNAKSKVIEPYFNYLNKTYCQRFPNFSGFNITSKKSNQPNTEFLDRIKHSFPEKEGVTWQIEAIMKEERKRKIQAYMEGWQSCPDEEKILMSKLDMLMVYGKPTGYTNTITGRGLTVAIAGNKIVYDSFDPEFRNNQHLKWQVVYDECDLSSILVISEDRKKRFVLDQKRALPMDVHSMTKEDHQYRTKINQFNTERRAEVIQTMTRDSEVVQNELGNTVLQLDDFSEATLKLMFTYSGQQKERLQDAKKLKRVIEGPATKAPTAFVDDSFMREQKEFLNGKTDFNQYLD